MTDNTNTPTIPALEDINDMFDRYQQGLDNMHLKLLVYYPTDDIDDLIRLLQDCYTVTEEED